MADSRVALTRCGDYEPVKVAEAVARQFALLGGVERFVKRGDRVLVKPNFISPRSHRHATQTHPAVIVEVARLLKDFGARPFVGDSSAWANALVCAKALRLEEPLKALGVPIEDRRWQAAVAQDRRGRDIRGAEPGCAGCGCDYQPAEVQVAPAA